MTEPKRILRSRNNGYATQETGQTAGEFDSSLGAQIRELRLARDLTLAEVATNAGRSPGYLSQVERNLTAPTIKSLHSIAHALGVNISWFFNEEKPTDHRERPFIVRGDARRTLRFGSGIIDELLSPHLRGRLELLYSRFEPGASSGDDTYRHRGEEAGIVMVGNLELWIGEDHFLLHQGDSFSFQSTTPHRYRNPGSTETLVIWAITPPTY
jgi:transcriptional regulator with XRE-family HTH domain